MATCLRCGNEWEPRKACPKKCPSCQNPNWNRPRRKRQAVVAQPGERPIRNRKVEGSTPFDSSMFDVEAAKRRAESLLERLI